MQACSKSIIACQTFAFYSSSFTKSANQAIAAEDPANDPSKSKRWDILNRFEAHFNHWYVHFVRLFYLILTMLALLQVRRMFYAIVEISSVD